MTILDWIKNRLSPDPSLSFQQTEPPEGEEEPPEPVVVAARFRVTTVDELGKDGKVLFVYGRDQAEACGRIPSPLLVNARIELAGHVENGVVHFPPDELREAMASMQDGRRAPGA